MMKTIDVIKKSTLILLASVIMACGSETVIATVFIPAFAATWPVVGDENYEIDLQPDEDNKGVASGVFNGAEFHQTDPDRNGNDLSGSFDGLDIEFTIVRPNGSVRYTGKMIPVSDTDHTIVRIELTSSEGDLILGF
ncbi:hypothetical protein [Saccharicrinis sp. GN24d3]|uniref:hypothetical protein n=1 Tax=Saccharicrinis sp. GN24d3 TaxID=3458416 RepID=UPI00403563DF